MRKYINAETETIENIICNQCGRKIRLVNGIPREDVFHGEKSWGYFSRKDGRRHSLDLCEECYDRWVAGFAVPVTEQEENELL